MSSPSWPILLNYNIVNLNLSTWLNKWICNKLRLHGGLLVWYCTILYVCFLGISPYFSYISQGPGQGSVGLPWRKVATNYNIIQFGVALFTKDTDKKYIVHVFNFYAFPEKGFVNMEAGSVHFNSRNGMDWNKWILGGIPYVDKESAEKLRQSIFPAPETVQPQPQQTGKQRIVLSNPQDIETTTKAVESLKGWLLDEGRKEEKEFELLTTNSYLRRFLYEHLRESMPDLVLESRPTKARGLSTMVALRLTNTEKLEREAKLQKEKETEFRSKLGLRRIFLALAAAKKTLVGHALLFDLLFAFSHFEGLPESYEEFKELSRQFFPSFFDTQVLAKSHLFRMKPQNVDRGQEEQTEQTKTARFSSLALGQVYKVLKQEAEEALSCGQAIVKFNLAEGHERYDNSASFHEAGYDAFITGCVFAYMCDAVGRRPDEFNGHLMMFRGLYNFNLLGEDELLTKGTYLHIKGLKGRGVQDLQDSLQVVLSLRWSFERCWRLTFFLITNFNRFKNNRFYVNPPIELQTVANLVRFEYHLKTF